MENEIIVHKDGNTYIGAIASRVATTKQVRLNGQVYNLAIKGPQPAVKLTSDTPGLKPLTLEWGTCAFLTAIESGQIELVRDCKY